MSKLAVQNEETKQRQAALAQMNPELRQEFESIYSEVKAVAARNVHFYHKIGSRARDIHANTTKYGEGAVDKIAKAISIDRGMIYKSMTFSSMFTKEELKDLMERETKSGGALTWSHFSQLVHVEDRKQVDELIKVIFRDDLSVRGLRDLLRSRAYSGSVAGRQAAPRTVMGGLSQLLAMSNRLVEKFTDEFDDSVFDPLGRIEDGLVTEEMLKRVGESEESLLALAKQAEDKAAELKDLKAQLEKQATSAATEKQAAAAAKQETKEAPKAAPKAAAKPPVKPAAKPVPSKGEKPTKRSRRPVEA